MLPGHSLSPRHDPHGHHEPDILPAETPAALRGNTPSMPTITFKPMNPPAYPGPALPRRSWDSPNPSEGHHTTPRPLRITKLRPSPSRQFHQPRSEPAGSEAADPSEQKPESRQRANSVGALPTTSLTMGTLSEIAPAVKEKEKDKEKEKSKKKYGKSKLARQLTKKEGGAGMSWLQKQKRSHSDNPKSSPGGDATQPARNTCDKASSGSSSTATVGSRYGTAVPGQSDKPPLSAGPVAMMESQKTELYRRATTGSYGTKSLQKFEKLTEVLESTQETTDATAAEEKGHSKGWKKRVFSKDLFSPSHSSGKAEGKNTASVEAESASRPTSPAQTIVRRKVEDFLAYSIHDLHDLPTNENGSFECGEITMTAPLGDYNQAARNIINDSVIAIFEGKIGRRDTSQKLVRQWVPPRLTLDLEVFSEVDKMPVSLVDAEASREFWVAVEVSGKVNRGNEFLGDDVHRVGLDVGVLLDISSYSTPSFEDLKYQAKAIVEAIDTSCDRISVMTFSSPPRGKRTPSSAGRANLQVLNSSGSMAKKSLLDSITFLEPDAEVDPTGRDVAAAVLAAVKMLANMPLDTSKHGTRRHPHLFLLTSELRAGELNLVPETLYGDAKVHVIGIGGVFCPKSEMGGNGWCVSTYSHEPTAGLERVVSGDVTIPVTHPQSAKQFRQIKEVVSNLRAGVDLGDLTEVKILLKPEDGCIIKAVIGETFAEKLLPGEKRTLLVRLEITDFAKSDIAILGHDSALDDSWCSLTRDIEATLGELKSRVLEVTAAYRHRSFQRTTLTTERMVELVRYTKDSVWAAHEGMPEFFLDTWRGDHAEYVRKALIRKLASSHANPRRAQKAVDQVATARATRGADFSRIHRELSHRIRLRDKYQSVKSSQRSSKKPKRIPLPSAFDGTVSTDFSQPVAPLMPLSPGAAAQISNVPADTPDTAIFDGSAAVKPQARRSTDGASGYSSYRTAPTRDITPQRRATLATAVPDSPDEAKKLWRDLRREKAGKSGIYGSIRSNRSGRKALTATMSVLEGEMELESELDFTRMEGRESRRRERSQERDEPTDGDSDAGETAITLRDVLETDFSPWAL